VQCQPTEEPWNSNLELSPVPLLAIIWSLFSVDIATSLHYTITVSAYAKYVVL
jgi:hypothetical protein